MNLPNKILQEYKELFPDISEGDISRELENLKGLQNDLSPNKQFKNQLRNKLEHLHELQSDLEPKGFSWFQYAGVIFTTVFAFSLLYSLYDIQKTGFDPLKRAERSNSLQIEMKGSQEFDAQFEDIVDSSIEMFENEIMGIENDTPQENIEVPTQKKVAKSNPRNIEKPKDSNPVQALPPEENRDEIMKPIQDVSNSPSAASMMDTQADDMQDTPAENLNMMESRMMMSDAPPQGDNTLVCEENMGVVSDDGNYCSFPSNKVCFLEEIESCLQK
ncbi:hypothetical protein GW846_05300 [Candidatus Gracilibacteria bacterium]|nr:hypothetical protein [Candidatus Gracilibacteria bacterium]